MAFGNPAVPCPEPIEAFAFPGIKQNVILLLPIVKTRQTARRAETGESNFDPHGGMGAFAAALRAFCKKWDFTRRKKRGKL